MIEPGNNIIRENGRYARSCYQITRRKEKKNRAKQYIGQCDLLEKQTPLVFYTCLVNTIDTHFSIIINVVVIIVIIVVTKSTEQWFDGVHIHNTRAKSIKRDDEDEGEGEEEKSI